ncbi:MAG: hypothetical protein ACYDA6_08425 [Solirubrobacteraceae bacterium]
MLLGSVAFYTGLAIVIARVPSARVPALLAVVILFPGQSIVMALIRARRKGKEIGAARRSAQRL